ncbi:hypothetical protein TNCV_1952771 [Trichonephila clavipes]|nr:hypothetical protein TNCV_1952771 [Trichonephila clavipes]
MTYSSIGILSLTCWRDLSTLTTLGAMPGRCSSPVTNRLQLFPFHEPSIHRRAVKSGPRSWFRKRARFDKYSTVSKNSLKIIQFNINGISTSALRVKLDQVLELALTEGAQIIALQETNLKTLTSLKIKGYNIFRLDRQNRSGRGLAFLIKNINYQCINMNRKITVGSNLKIKDIRIIWKGKPLNIFNMYHPPDLKSLPTDLQNLFSVGTICLGDLNANTPFGAVQQQT